MAVTTIPEITKLGVFAPLRAFSNLTHLLIGESCNLSISDEELCYLTGAWPKLQVLQLSCCVANDSDTITVTTFHGLICLLQLCPALTSLTLVIDATKLDGIDLKCPGGKHFTHHLKDLTLGNSVIHSPLNVALILSGLVPYLERLDLKSSYMKESEMEKWALVNSFLHAFSVVRERSRHIVP
jgi:hypothetical protein